MTNYLSALKICVRLSYSSVFLFLLFFFLLCCNSTHWPLRCGVLFVVLSSVAAPLKQTLVHQPQRLFAERKAAFPQTVSWFKDEVTEKSQNAKCLQFLSVSHRVCYFLFFFCHVTDVWFNLTVLMWKRQQRLS